MKLVVQYLDNKFVNSILDLTLDKLSIKASPIHGILYQLYYQDKFDYIIFMESGLSNEILQFISEFFNEVKCYVYHDKNINTNLINEYGKSITHLVKSPCDLKTSNIILLPELINTQIFSHKDDIKKTDDIVCFLEHKADNEISADLKRQLYPSTKNPIKLFNSPFFKHPQNIGLVSEKDKSQILQKAKALISLDGEYILEAMECGCQILDGNLEPINIKKQTHNTYEQFMKELLNVK